MKKLGVVLCVLGLGFLVACGGGGGGGNNGGGGGGVSVSITPNGSVPVGVTLMQQFTAHVSGTTNTAVNWSLSGSGCMGAACGNITSNGLYTAPAAPPSPATVTVKATSAADGTKSGSANVSVVHITVSVAPNTAIVAKNGAQQFTAQVNPASPVTWTVTPNAGTTCSMSTCGTVDSTGLYTAPSSLPAGNPPIVKVTATSTIDTAQIGSSTANVTLVSSFNSRFNGTYAFHFAGFDAVGAVYIVGSFHADGAGNITNGTQDISRAGGITTSSAFVGSYSLSSNNRGTVTLGSSVFQMSLGANGEATIVEFDASGTRGTGVVDLATTPFSTGEILGPYVMGLYGRDASSDRVGVAALFQSDGAGNITVGAVDINDDGTPTSGSNVSGTYTVNASNGRGTMTLTDPMAGTFHFSFYIVSAGELFFLATDPTDFTHPRILGLALAQAAGPYSAASLNGAAVFDVTGLNSATNANVVAIGLLSGNGSGGLNAGSEYAENNAGTITAQQALSGSYIMAANGRGVVTLTGTAPAPSFVFYAADLNKGFLLDVSSSNALSGELLPQNAGQTGTFNNSTLQGTFAFGTRDPDDASADNLAGIIAMDGAGNLTTSSIQDRSTSAMNFVGEALRGTYSVSSSGRATMSLTSPTTTGRTLYLVDNGKFMAIGTDSGDQHSTVVSSAR